MARQAQATALRVAQSSLRWLDNAEYQVLERPERGACDDAVALPSTIPTALSDPRQACAFHCHHVFGAPQAFSLEFQTQACICSRSDCTQVDTSQFHTIYDVVVQPGVSLVPPNELPPQQAIQHNVTASSGNFSVRGDWDSGRG